jgi:predicted HAD superfamily Cof-like phosphohydrolase
VLRRKLIREEFKELMKALEEEDIVGIADGLADLTVVVYGTALSYGIDLDRVMQEVHRSNMSKLGEDGKPIYREDGKVLKGPYFSPPDILHVLS